MPVSHEILSQDVAEAEGGVHSVGVSAPRAEVGGNS